MFLITSTLLLFIKICQCSYEFTAHNFVNYKVGGNDFGIQYLAVHGKLRQFFPEKFGFPSEESSVFTDSDKFSNELSKLLRSGRNVYLLKFNDLLTKKFHWIFFKSVLKTTNNTVLLILPKKNDILSGGNKYCDEAHATDFANTKLQKCNTSNNTRVHEETLNNFERYLYKSRPKCSLSLTEIDDNIAEILKHTKHSGGLFSDDVRVSTPRFDASPITNFLTINLFGELAMKTTGAVEGEPKDLKKVLVTCSLDTFGVLQTYSSGAQFNSSLVFLLELTRVLSSLENPHYELVFLLHSGSVVDYAGLRYFLRNKKDFEFAVHFQDLTGDNLYLHMLKSQESLLDQYAKVFASKMNISKTFKHPNPQEREEKPDPKTMDFNHVHEEHHYVNLPNDIDFETLNSFTITSSPELLPLYKSSYSLTHRFDVDLLTHRIVDAAKAFAHLLKTTPPELNNEEIRSNVVKWENKLAEPRNSLTGNLLLLESVKDVISFLENNLRKVQVQNFRTAFTTYKFFSSAPNKCTVYTTKHPAFDIVVFALVMMYVLSVWSVARGSVKVAIEDITGLFQKLLNENNFKFKRR
ncbi:hypothetical protein MACJ_000386 [Theileria orientalis]|uniref:Nicalin n=1 Tax=Theileria orientalis TaxID=68886 RepID=A0A976M3Z8_THEOR|nr:hypothetical protein MACJ_000386 [Theileria orientalis]